MHKYFNKTFKLGFSLNVLLGLYLLLLITPGYSQSYMSFESKNFQYAIDEEKMKRMPYLSDICEEVYSRLTEVFDYKLDEKTVVVFRDEADYSNGYAYGFKNWIGIYLPSSNSMLRGSRYWLKEVIAHELSHVFTLRKLGYNSSFLSFKVRTSSSANHRGSSFGYPYSINSSVTYSVNNEEKWLVEGLAQLGAELVGLDHWDSHRAMHERVRYISDAILPLSILKTFSEDSRTREGLYNQGYSFMRFIYGTLERTQFNFLLLRGSKAGLKNSIAEHFKVEFSEVYQMWKRHLDNKYAVVAKDSTTVPMSTIQENSPYVVERSPLVTEDEMFLLSSRENDYGETSLYRMTEKGYSQIAKGVDRPVIKHDSLLYYIQGDYNDFKHHTLNLMSYNPQSGEVKRITEDDRVYAVQPCNDSIYIIVRENGYQYIKTLSSSSSYTIQSNDSIELVSLACYEDTLLVTGVTDFGQSIYHYDEYSNQLEPFIDTDYDERDPIVQNDILYFSANYTGSHQIYQKVLPDGPVIKLTSVVGGAFEPYIYNNEIYFTEYTHSGFIISKSVESATPFDYMKLTREQLPLTSYGTSLNSRENELASSTSNTNGLRYLGFDLSLSVIHAPVDSKSNKRRGGTKFGGGFGLNYVTPDNQTALYSSIELFSGPLNLTNKDKPFNYTNELDSKMELGFSTSAFTPYISTELSIFNWTYEAANNYQDVGGVSTEIFIANSILNFYLNSEIQLSNHFSVFSFLEYMGAEYQWVGSERLRDTWTLFAKETNIGLGLEYSDKEYGMYGVNKGLYLSLSPKIFIREQLEYDSILDQDNMVKYGYSVYSAKIKMYGNIQRKVLINGAITGFVNSAHGYTASKQSTSAYGECSMKLIPPNFSIGSSSVIKRPSIVMEYSGLLRTQPSDLSPQQAYNTTSMRTLNSERNSIFSQSVGHSNNVHTTGLFLLLENLTFFNLKTQWKGGVEFEYSDHSWSPQYVLNVQL
ncbi:MAG: hypothetical protein OCC49_13810 [Fibrobacterales bacterium]